MTDYKPDDIMRMFGVDNEPPAFAKGGIIPPGSDLLPLMRCLNGTGGAMPRPSADDAVRVTVSPAEHITDPDRAEALGLTVDAKRMRGYGDVITTVDLHEVGDGTVEHVVKVVHADDMIGVATEALHQFDPRYFDEDGNLALSGEYVYRPVHFAEQGRVVVCERVR